MSIKVDETLAKYMHDYVVKTCDEIGPRAPGSVEERKGAELVVDYLNELCNDVKLEEFKVSPKAFLGWIQIVVPMLIISLFIFKIFPLFSGILMTIAIFIAIMEFVLYKQLLDPVFPKKTSQNVIGTIMPSGEAKRTIVFSGHVDSAYQFNFIRWWGGVPYFALVFTALVLFFAFTFLSIMNAIVYLISPFIPSLILGIIDTIFTGAWFVFFVVGIPIGILFFLFTTWKPVPGASDNLSAVAVVLGIGKFLKDARESGGFFPKNTKVQLVVFGSEESGLRGSKYHAKIHEKEMKSEDSIVINMEVLTEPDSFYLLTTDLNGTVGLSKDVVVELEQTMNDLGYSPKRLKTPIGAGSTDSAALAQKGIKTTCIFGGNFGDIRASYINYYHTVRDTPDKVQPEALRQVCEICLNYLKKKDGELS
ncbi:MAG: M28 family metallopeptidase [Candidatus Helarchaeales archaeon]